MPGARPPRAERCGQGGAAAPRRGGGPAGGGGGAGAAGRPPPPGPGRRWTTATAALSPGGCLAPADPRSAALPFPHPSPPSGSAATPRLGWRASGVVLRRPPSVTSNPARCLLLPGPPLTLPSLRSVSKQGASLCQEFGVPCLPATWETRMWHSPNENQCEIGLQTVPAIQPCPLI